MSRRKVASVDLGRDGREAIASKLEHCDTEAFRKMPRSRNFFGSVIGANVRAADPHVVEAGAIDAIVARVEPTREEISGADAVLLLTDHDAFDINEVAAHASYLLDCRRVAPAGENVETL